MTRSAPSVIVVGGGAFGVTAALELRKRGGDVSLFDPGPLPRPEASSTDISKAVRMDYGDDVLYTEMAEQALPVWESWNRSWGEDLYHEDGFLFLTREPMVPGGFEHESFELLQQRGQRLERMNPQRLRQRHPQWAAEHYPDGYFNPRGGWASSARVVARLVQDARALGVGIQEGMAFRELHEGGGRIAGIVTADGAVHAADFVLMATGAWTPTLLPHLQGALRTVAQPVLHFGVPDPEPFQAPHFVPWGADLSRTGWYGFPALADGTLKIAHHGPGSPVHPDTPRAVPPEWEERFRGFLRETFPAVAEAPRVGGRLCLYCDSFDGNFWIDHDPDRPGLVVAAGGSGHGFKFAPVLGGLIADVLERKENRFAPRFRWRTPDKNTVEKARYTGD